MDDLGQNLEQLRQERNKYIKRHEWYKAIHVIEKMIEILPTPSFYTRKGMIEIKIKKYRDAIDSLKQALHLEPGYLKARQILMKLSSRMVMETDPLDNLMSNSQAMLLYGDSVNSHTDSFETLDKGITNADGTLLLMPESDEPLRSVSPMSDITNMSALPQQFGVYRDLRIIGSGSMGIVYRAYNPKNKKFVAIKVLHNEKPIDINILKREASILSTLHHPNIVNTHEVNTFEGSHCIVMDYIKGETLKDYMANKNYSFKEALQIIKFIALAMDYAHQNGIIHCDLKPSNIIIEQDTSLPIVMDFGLAANISNIDKNSKNEVSGTPRYMAPEQALGKKKKISPATDIYAIGAILYEMITKFPVITAQLPKEALNHIIHKSVVSPQRRNPQISPEIEAICMKCLSKDITSRYSSAKDLAKDIDRFFAGEAVSAPRWSTRRKIVQYIFQSKRNVVILFFIFLTSASMILSTYNYRESQNVALWEKELLALKKKTYTLQALQTKYPRATENIVVSLQFEKDLELSIHHYEKMKTLLFYLYFNHDKPKFNEEIVHIDKEIAELILFSPNQDVSMDYFFKSVNKKNDQDEVYKKIEQQKEILDQKRQNLVVATMENKEQVSYDNLLLQLLKNQSPEVTTSLLSYFKTDEIWQKKLIINYLVISKDQTIIDGKNIREWLLEILENMNIEEQQQEEEVKLLIYALAHFRK